MASIRILLSILIYALCCSARVLGNDKLKPRAGSLEQVTNFGDNPTNVGMYVYVPNNLASNPAIIVGIHWCECPPPLFSKTPICRVS